MKPHSSSSNRSPPKEDRDHSHSHHSKDHRYDDRDDYYDRPPPFYPPYVCHGYRPYPMPPPPPPYHNYPSQPYPRRKKKHMYHLESEKRTKVHTIFMFNVSYKISNDKLLEFCSQFGEVSELIYPLSKRGMGFVTYYDIRNAEKAVKEMNGYNLDGRTLHTNFAYKPPAHSKRKLEEICDMVIVNIDSVKSKLRSLREAKNSQTKDDSKKQDYSEDDEEINQEISKFASDLNITADSVQTVLSAYGEIKAVEERGCGSFLVRYYDIRSAQKCIKDGKNYVEGEPVSFEYPPDSELGDDETNSEFTKEEYFRKFRNNDNKAEGEGEDDNDYNNNDNEYDYDKAKSDKNDDNDYDKNNEDTKNSRDRERLDDRDRDRDREREREFDRDKRRYHDYNPHYRGPPGRGPMMPPPGYSYYPYPPPPMDWYPPRPPPQGHSNKKYDSRNSKFKRRND